MHRRNVLVTGGTQGLGAAIARHFAREGYRVIVNGLGNPVEIATFVEKMASDTAGDVRYHDSNLADENQVWALADFVDGLGGIDVLINNAAVRHFDPIETLPLASWQLAMAVNATAPFQLIQRALPRMKAQKWGRIVNISSILAFAGRRDRVDYVANKSAISGLTRAVAAETVEFSDITCNSLAPGTMRTEHIENRIAEIAAERGLSLEEAEKRLLQSIGQDGDMIDTGRVAKFIAFLCSDDGRDINGAMIPIDAGMHVTWLNPQI